MAERWKGDPIVVGGGRARAGGSRPAAGRGADDPTRGDHETPAARPRRRAGPESTIPSMRSVWPGGRHCRSRLPRDRSEATSSRNSRRIVGARHSLEELVGPSRPLLRSTARAIDWQPPPSRGTAEIVFRSHQSRTRPPPPTSHRLRLQRDVGLDAGVAGGSPRFQGVLPPRGTSDPAWARAEKPTSATASSTSTWTRSSLGTDWHEREAWEMFGITSPATPPVTSTSRRVRGPPAAQGLPAARPRGEAVARPRRRRADARRGPRGPTPREVTRGMTDH